MANMCWFCNVFDAMIAKAKYYGRSSAFVLTSEKLEIHFLLLNHCMDSHSVYETLYMLCAGNSL